MDIEAKQAQQTLQAIEQARIAAHRHSHNNGVVPLVQGVLVVAIWSLFDLLPASQAGPVSLVVATIWGLWAVLYAKRLPVRPHALKNKWLFAWWGALYYPLVIAGAFALFPHQKLPFFFTLVGLTSALPQLVVGMRLWRAAGQP